jgi:hypothetical protein
MCATPCLKLQAVLALAAIVVVPVAVAKVILSAPTPRAVVGALALVAKKAKALKESATETLDEFTVC